MDKLKLKDKEYPFLFAIRAQREMSKEDLTQKDDIYYIWLGLKYGSIKQGLDFNLSEDDLIDIFDDELEQSGESQSYQKAAQLLGDHMGKLKKMRGMATQEPQ
jgi:hypothetical protein